MISPTDKQLSYLLTLANKLTGQGARYLSQSSVLPKSVGSSAEASGLIDDLRAAIEAEEKRQETTGLIIGARLRHHYVTAGGVEIIAEGVITGYGWSGLAVESLSYDATPETRQAAGFGESARTKVTLSRLGAPADDSPQVLLAERERLVARVAEIDALLAAR